MKIIMVEEKWAKNYDKCQNCRTVSLHHRAKGYCTRCYRLVKKLELVGDWDPSEPTTLIGYPPDFIVPDYIAPAKFSRIKMNVTTQLKRRLEYFKLKEEALAGPIHGLDIEHQLEGIARRCRVKKKEIFFGIATTVNRIFDMKQRRFLYRQLNKIEENVSWVGIDWLKALQE
jgi:hypothetical protein